MVGTGKALYVTLPRSILSAPPLLHRHDRDHRHKLTPFEFAVVAGCLRLARLQLGRDKHARSIAGGAEAILQEQRNADEFKQKWKEVNKARRSGEQVPAPKRKYTYPQNRFTLEPDPYRPPKRGRSLQLAGSYGYKMASKALRHKLPPSITVQVTRSAILRHGGLQADGANLRKLNAALDRACQPFGDVADAPLQSWDQLANGQLQLVVRGGWLEPPYGRVPLPLPLRSATALALYLLLQTIDTSAANTRSIKFATLCERLGVPTHWGAAVCRRAVHCALQIVNEHLAKLPHEALERNGVVIAARYDIVPIAEGGHVRLTSTPYQYRNPEDQEDVQEDDDVVRARINFEQPTSASNQRVRLTEEARRRLAKELRTRELVEEGRKRAAEERSKLEVEKESTRKLLQGIGAFFCTEGTEEQEY